MTPSPTPTFDDARELAQSILARMSSDYYAIELLEDDARRLAELVVALTDR